jgi:hypothetical protein
MTASRRGFRRTRFIHCARIACCDCVCHRTSHVD